MNPQTRHIKQHEPKKIDTNNGENSHVWNMIPLPYILLYMWITISEVTARYTFETKDTGPKE